MDFIDILKQFASQAIKKKDQLQTEEATKMALIMPFFSQVLGYDVFNPDEFTPEFVADVGIKRGEKVDYAININGKPTILVEAKKCGENLEKHDSQLFRYFGTTEARFAILTNGIVYRFYTDLNEANKMDLEPFFEINLENIKESQVPHLKRFTKASFDAEEMFDFASNLRFTTSFKQNFAALLKDPTDEFVRFMLTDVYQGVKTQAVVERFRPLIKSALNGYVNEIINERIASALTVEEEKEEKHEEPEQVDVSEQPEEAEKSGIVTTEEEIESYYIICAILGELIEIERIVAKDTRSYYAILIDGMPTKWICRLRLEGTKRNISFRSRDERISVETPKDIYKYKDELKASLAMVLK